MRRFSGFFVVIALLLVSVHGARGQGRLLIVSGPPGGFWNGMGDSMAEAFDGRLGGAKVSNVPGAAVSNVLAVGRGQAEMGFTFAHLAYDGYSARGKFRKTWRDLRHFASTYVTTFQAAVPSNLPVASLGDLRDKTISLGKTGWVGSGMAEAVLLEYGLDMVRIRRNGGDVRFLDYSVSAAMMRDGELQALLAVATVPNALFTNLTRTVGIRVVGIGGDSQKKFLKGNPGFVPQTLPRDAYPGMKNDVPTVGVVHAIIVHKDLPPDVVYRMVKEFWARSKNFKKIVPEWKQVKLENALQGAAIPVHPGARRFYDERGVRK